MPLITRNVTMNGTSNFNMFGQNYTWGTFAAVGVFPGGPPDTYRLNLTLSGTAWGIQALTFDSGSSFAVNITDTNDGLRRTINFLQFGDGISNANVTLYNTRVRLIEGGSGDTTLTLGDQRTRFIELFDGNDTITQGNGTINSVFMNGGTNVFSGGNGTINYVNFGPGTNTFTSGAGSVGTIRADGSTSVTLSNGAEQVLLGDGINTVTVTGGTVDSLAAYGNDTITFQGDARADQLKIDEGVNQVTSDTGFINSIMSFHGKNTITIGTGGVGQILLTGSPEAQVVTVDGFLGSLQVFAGNQVDVQATRVTTGDGGAGYIQTSKGNDSITTGSGSVGHIDTFDGNDTITLGASGAGSIVTGIGNDTVNTISGAADLIKTEDGNDLVVLGAAGGRFVALGSGDDTISLAAIPANFGISIDGNEGSDTANLSRFTQGLTVALNLGDAFQDFGALGVGFYLLHDIENLIGTAKNDIFIGSDLANRLTSGLGADNLSGLGGDDFLIGGKGNDTQSGGAGIDTFVFAAGDGTDRITDFTLGEDLLSIAGTRRLADISFAKVGANVDVSVGTLHIIVEDVTVAAMRDAANFVF